MRFYNSRILSIKKVCALLAAFVLCRGLPARADDLAMLEINSRKRLFR